MYCFSGEDKHQHIAHIQHENSWVVEPELNLSQRKFNKDCLDGNNQVQLINKIIEMATVDSET